MKYAMVSTAFRGDTQTVEGEYLNQFDDLSVYFGVGTRKLSEATIWNTFDEAADFIEKNNINDQKIVSITEEKLFQARLKGT